jgi:hypothetical protein
VLIKTQEWLLTGKVLKVSTGVAALKITGLRAGDQLSRSKLVLLIRRKGGLALLGADAGPWRSYRASPIMG